METMMLEGMAAKAASLPYHFAKQYGVLLVDVDDSSGAAHLFLKDDTSALALIEARRVLGRPLRCEQISTERFNQMLASTYEGNAAQNMQLIESMEQNIDLTHLAENLPEQTDLLESDNNAPVIRLINALITEAIKQNASDIHIEPSEKQLDVRFRVDGMLRPVVQLKRTLAPVLVSRVKVMAKLDIAEKRIPQDGHIPLKLGEHDFDIRVSTIPATGGERVVLRLLDKQSGSVTLEALGMSPYHLELMRSIIQQPHGIVLVTGPTGSGKTTTLYAALRILCNGKRSILTIEDPVEIVLEGVGQTEVNPKVDMTFARGLRAILRQDPDIIMVGEIRDLETAQIAVQASLTGHMVFSTLHTNSAVGAITRLYDMGIEPFLLSSSLTGLIAQRLVRKLCSHCKQPHTLQAGELAWLERDGHIDPVYSANPVTIYKAVGCPECQYTGYRGRTGIYEIIQVEEKLRRLIHDHRGEAAYRERARECGPGMLEDASRLIHEGITSVEEVLRIMQSERE